MAELFVNFCYNCIFVVVTSHFVYVVVAYNDWTVPVRELELQSEKNVEPTGCLNVKFWEEAGPIKCVQSHLKRLMLREFHGMTMSLLSLCILLKMPRYWSQWFLWWDWRSEPEELAAKMKALDNARWACGSSKLGYMISRLGEEEGSVWNFTVASELMCNDPFFCGV